MSKHPSSTPMVVNGDLFRTIGLPPDTSMIDFPLIEGRWLRPDDENALVVNHVMLVDHDPSMTVGSELVMDINGQVTTWTVVGIVRQVGQGVAYANQDCFAVLAGLEGESNHVQIVGNDGSEAGQTTLLQTVEAALLNAGVDVTVANTSQDGRQVLVDHFYIIVTLLMLMAALVAAVSGLGLASTMRLIEFCLLQKFDVTGFAAYLIQIVAKSQRHFGFDFGNMG
ncbi:MAG: hypothetical protein GY796_13955 [Chloroflexi bacterium]|nr:hypothetical protein [Chloroflexota bacterium]